VERVRVETETRIAAEIVLAERLRAIAAEKERLRLEQEETERAR
jgi:hypothetical protein